MKRTLAEIGIAGAALILSVASAGADAPVSPLSAALASASSAQYRGCDGYGAASGGGDGMTEYASVLLIFNPPGYGNTQKSQTDSGAAAISDCDAALGDLPPQHWMRKVSLLRARALHDLENNNSHDALSDLDAAQNAAGNSGDPFYLRSLKWGLDVVRAYALRRSGDQAGATTLAMQAFAQRVYNRQTIISALDALGPRADEADIHTVQEGIARLVPAYVDLLFLRAFNTGHFAEAMALYSQVSPPEEIGRVALSTNDQAGRNWRNFHTARIFWAVRDGMYAYALAATGKDAEALAGIDAARTRLKTDTVPPLPLADRATEKPEDVALWQGDADIRARSATEGAAIIDKWNTFVQMRIDASKGKTDEITAATKSKALPPTWVSIDLLDQVQNQLPKAQRRPAPEVEALRTRLMTARPDVRDAAPADFFGDLPSAETAARVPSYSKANTPWFNSSDNAVSGEGYRIGTMNADGVTTVRFHGGAGASRSMVEELALLCAADTARQSGKKGLIVVGREDIDHTVTTTYYGRPVRTDPGGFETALKVLFVDPAALPDKYKNASWRVMDADAIDTALAPVYLRTGARN